MKNSRQMKNSLVTHALGMALVSMAAAPTGSHAQQRQAGIDEIVVTATRREQSLQEVPLAVTAISAGELQVKGINSLADITGGQLPGIHFQRYAGVRGALIVSARGLSQPDGVQGTLEQPVPIYIDGVSFGRATGLGIELIDPERIEILRGPQGQLFGRNAEGGAVQFVSRKPTGEFGVRAKASVGNYGLQSYRLAIDLPKTAGFSATLTGLVSERDGFTEQATAPQAYDPPGKQRDWGLYDSSGFRAALRWQSDEEDWTVDYAYDMSDMDETNPYTSWMDYNNGVPANPFTPPSTDFPDRSVQKQYVPLFENTASGHTLTIENRLSDSVSLKSITAYRESGRKGTQAIIEGLGIPLLPTNTTIESNFYIFPTAYEDVDQEQFSQELQFIGTWDQFDLTAGLMYFNEQIEDLRISEFTGPGVFVLPTCATADPCPTTETYQEVETESFGIYAQGSYRPSGFDNKLELILGLRWTDDTKDAVRKRDIATDVFVTGNVFGGAVNIPSKFSEKRVDPAFTVRYQWTDDLNTYLRYATGYRAGGVSVRSTAFESFDAEVLKTWEIGMKAQWFDALRVNLALFHNTIEDAQIAFQEDPNNNPALQTLTNLPDDKTIKGAELEMIWAATDNVTMGLSFTYMDAKIIYDIDNPFDNSNTLYRYWQVQTPDTAGSIYLDYHQPISVGSMDFHVSYAYSDGFYQGDGGSTPTALLPPDSKRPTNESSELAARLTWGEIPVGNGAIDIALWGKNLTDDSKVVFGFDGCASGGGWCTYRADPRTYGVDLQYRY